MTQIWIFNVFIYETNLFIYYSMRSIALFWHCFFTMLTQNLAAFIFVLIYNIGMFRLHRIEDSACSGIIDIFWISFRRWWLPDEVNWTYYILSVRFKLSLARIFMVSPYNVLQIRFIGIILVIIGVFLFGSLSFAITLRYNMLQVLIILLNHIIFNIIISWLFPWLLRWLLPISDELRLHWTATLADATRGVTIILQGCLLLQHHRSLPLEYIYRVFPQFRDADLTRLILESLIGLTILRLGVQVIVLH